MKEMPLHCHRCHAELPEPSARVDTALFCPQCSAPQLFLPDYLRVEAQAQSAGEPGADRPEDARRIDWHAALPTAGLVALVGAVLSVAGWRLPFFAAISPVWVLISGAVVLVSYLRRRPEAWLDAQAGWRLGVVTGLLLVGAKGAALAATGMTARYVTHSMAAFDAEIARNVEAGRQMTAGMLPARARENKAFMAHYEALLVSPEIKAGRMLVMAGVQGLFVILFAGLGGTFYGSLEARRRALLPRR